jgi:hypothetical protein
MQESLLNEMQNYESVWLNVDLHIQTYPEKYEKGGMYLGAGLANYTG